MSTEARMDQRMEMAHVLFMDIVGYSKLPMNEQSLVVEDLKQIVQAAKEFTRATNQHELVVLHTGDGMALAFFGGPEAPVRCALEIAKALQAAPQIRLRMGVHSGPVYRVKDIKGNDNVAGGGINFAQRVMDCGDGGHILLSSTTAELLVQHSEWAKHIVEIGVAEVKHGARVHLYNLIEGELGNSEIPQKVSAQLQQQTNLDKPRGKNRAGRLWKLALGAVTTAATGTVLVAGWLYHQKAQHPPATTEATLGLSKYPPVATDVTRELSEYVKSQYAASLRGSSDGIHNVWTETQMRVALDGLGARDDSEMLRWLEGQMFPCHCWRRQPDDPKDHIGVTAWVLVAFSRLNHEPSHTEIEFLLSNQHSGGWWPQFPSTDQEENASTFATAMSVWALHELSKRALIPKPDKARVETAIQMGADWLISHHADGRPGAWVDYQAGDYKRESIGLSGLVLHVLHTLDRPVPERIDQDWMTRLPTELPLAGDEVATSHYVMLAGGGFASDEMHNFALPWLIIGTVDAYPSGDAAQQARARQILAQVANRGDEIRNEIQSKPWLAAEILLSLRYLQQDKII